MTATENREGRTLRRGWTTSAGATAATRAGIVKADVVIVDRQGKVIARAP